MSDQPADPATRSESTDQRTRSWQPPTLDRDRMRSPDDAVGLASSASSAALLADGERRRWHEMNDVAGLSALLGGRRPVRLPDEVARALAEAADRDNASSGVVPPDESCQDLRADLSGPMAGDPVDKALARARAEGVAAGEAVARDAFADKFAALARSITRERRKALDALEDELVALARSMAACAMRRELRSDPGALLEHVRDALDALVTALGSTAPVTVRMHPLDVAAIGEALGTDVNVVADASLERTDCRLERGAARLDASVCARLDALGLEHDPHDLPASLDADVDDDRRDAALGRSDGAVDGGKS